MHNRAVSYSLALHLGFLLIAVFGIPTLFEREQEWQPSAVTVEIVPIGERTNLPSKPKPISKPKAAPTPKNAKPVPKVKTETPKEKPLPKDAVAPPEPEKPAEPKPVEEKPKEKSEPKKEEDDFAVLMAKLRQQSMENPPEDAPQDNTAAEDNTSKSDYVYDDSAPLSLSERDAIRNQFIRCWRMPAGARDAYDLAVRVRVQVASNGVVEKAELASGQSDRYNSDTFFRAAADSAIRAVWRCKELQNLPVDKYGKWKDMELNFDPREMLY